MAQCSVTPKVCLGILTVVFWGCAAGLLYVGVTVYQELGEYRQLSEYLYSMLPAAVLMAVAGVLIIIGLLGCVGAFKEQRCLLGLYFTILLLVLVGSVAGGALGYIYRYQVDAGVRDGLTHGLDLYGNDTAWTQEIDAMQEQLLCCGVENATDWLSTPWHKDHPDTPVPASCYVDHKVANGTLFYEHGCYSYLRQQFVAHLGLVAGLSCGFAILLLIGIVCSCLLMCRQRTDPPYIGLSSPEHMRV